MTSTLMKRLKQLRETTDTSVTSECKSPTSLETFLRIYNKCRDGECYTDYMEGAKLLHSYLSPISIPPDLVVNSFMPALFHAYEVQQLAKILAGKEGYKNPNFNYIRNCIGYYTAKHIMEEIEL